MKQYDHFKNGVFQRTIVRPDAPQCLFFDNLSIPAGASDETLALFGLIPHVVKEAEVIDPQMAKSQKLKEAENRFISFCRSLGLPDNASSDDFTALVDSMPDNPIQGISIAVKALALINDVTQNDGKWSDIAWHADVAP